MSQSPTTTMVDEDGERRRILNRLKRLEGQVRGISSMIEAGKECEAVLTQVMAARSALNQVGMHVIGHAMKTCLVDEGITERGDLIGAAFDIYLRYRDLAAVKGRAPRPDITSTAHVMELLSRLETEVRRVQDVMGAAGECESALRELSAATGTLDEVGIAVLGQAMRRCLIDESAVSRRDVIEQAIQVFLRYSSCVR